jgi:hypothetical protein
MADNPLGDLRPTNCFAFNVMGKLTVNFAVADLSFLLITLTVDTLTEQVIRMSKNVSVCLCMFQHTEVNMTRLLLDIMKYVMHKDQYL